MIQLAPHERLALDRAFALAQDDDAPRSVNPRVGSVILDVQGRIAGEGFHRGAGTEHAEVVALRNAGGKAAGGTAVVTLEPCNHTGRTGPCVDALLEAGIKRVIFAVADPSSRASGGAQRLIAAGLEVIGDADVTRGLEINRQWFHFMRTGRPYVTAKIAMTLDGRVAAADGTSKWITSEESRREVHQLRSQCQAVVVGTGTVLADNPLLTVRSGGSPQPMRVVVGQREIPADSLVLNDDAATVLVRERDPLAVLRILAQHEVNHVLLESGPTMTAAWLQAGVIDEVLLYIAPKILGAGLSAFGDLGVTTLSEAYEFTPAQARRVGPDVCLTFTYAQG